MSRKQRQKARRRNRSKERQPQGALNTAQSIMHGVQPIVADVPPRPRSFESLFASVKHEQGRA
jgi:hypothetical protein